MGSLLLIAIVVMFVLLIPKGAPAARGHGITVMRSGPVNAAPGFSTCGGCHGTGQEGLGLADWGDCSMCDGRGYFKIDPNAKSYTLQELMDEMEAKETQRDFSPSEKDKNAKT